MATTKRVIVSNLVDREEVFKFLAVGEATGLPCLLVGVPGTGKTLTLTDYAKGFYREPSMTELQVGQKTLAESFILETDEGTRPADVKGRLDMKKLLVDNEYHVQAPVADAKFLLVNEIDKASSSMRNSLLGIMNEKFIFNGSEKVKCKWEVFCATCNVIPSEEKNSPFWDRFILKMEVKRLSKSNMQKFWKAAIIQAAPQPLHIHVPTKEEIASVKLDEEKLGKLLAVCYDLLSDRTLSYVPKIVAAVTFVYKLPVTRALVKTAELLTDYNTAKKLASQLEPKEVIEIRSKIELIMTVTDRTSLTSTLNDIKNGINKLVAAAIIGADIVQELKDEVSYAMSKNSLVATAATAGNPFTPDASFATTQAGTSVNNNNLAAALISADAQAVNP